MPQRKRYAIVGTGHRAVMFFKAVTATYADNCQLVAMCDVNQARMDYYNRKLSEQGQQPVPTFKADQFDNLVRQVKPDTVIVTTRDCDHDRYIIRAMELGCDVITEKPMTIDEHKCARVLDAIDRTGRKCAVTFNARYGPPESKVKELLASGVIGRVHSVAYEHLLDVRHGADYFRRWHRDKANSGGLMVHKCTHCFDLVNWWLGAVPKTVAAYGGVKFYGPQGLAQVTGQPQPEARARPAQRQGKKRGQPPLAQPGSETWIVPVRCRACHLTKTCKFYFDLGQREEYVNLYLAAEQEDGYFRDRCVFGDGVTTEDTVAVTVTYDSGAILSYQLTAFSPYEGNRIVFNGQTGRLEFTEIANTDWLVTTPDGSGVVQQKAAGATIEVFPQFAPAYRVDWESVRGGHGGADTRIMADLFGGGIEQPLGHKADHLDGARSILVGIAANRSMELARPVTIDELVKLPAKDLGH